MMVGSNENTAASLWSRAQYDPEARAKYFHTKWFGGISGVLIGAILAVVGGSLCYTGLCDQPKPRPVSDDELLKVRKPEDLQDWIVFTPSKLLDTGVAYIKVRSGQVTKKYFLVSVGDRWMLTQLDPRFTAGKIEGKLCEPDGLALEKIKGTFRAQARRMLPFQLDAEYSIATTGRQQTIGGGMLGGFGLICVFTGLGLLFQKSPPAMAGSSVETPPERPAPRLLVPPQGGQQLIAARYIVPEEQAPKQRSAFVRIFFSVVWAVVFFLGTAVVLSIVAVQRAGEDQELQKQFAEESGRTIGPWALLGSIVLASVLGCKGILPGTRR
jgi:hypothetical protein